MPKKMANALVIEKKLTVGKTAFYKRKPLIA